MGTRAPMTDVEDRFWSKTRIGDGCWEWTGAKTAGYGTFGIGGRRENGGRQVYAHRYAYELTHGPIPDGMEVCHNCPDGDNPACVRPTHLFVGTHAENMADMKAKGRAARGTQQMAAAHAALRARPELVPRGVRHGRAVIDDDIVREVRARYAAGETQMSIARALGLGQPHVSQIVRRQIWAHVAPEA